MGCTESTNNTIEVQDIQKSKKVARSPDSKSLPKSPISKSSQIFKAPSKVVYPTPNKRERDEHTMEDIKDKRSGSTLHEHSQNTNESRAKKKIKSVKVMPAAFERPSVVEDPEYLRNSSHKLSDSKIKNQKQELHHLLRIYDLV